MSQAHAARPVVLVAAVLYICSAAAAAAADRVSAPAGGSALVPAFVGAPDHRRAYAPRVRDDLRPSVRRVLALAYPLAVTKVRTIAVCRALFERLGADPVQVLMNSRYMAAKPERVRRPDPCQWGVAAVTAVGTPEVRLCLNFGSLQVSSAAITLLHEALHYAGLGEWPSSPDAMTSAQINLMVRDACGL